MKVFLPTFQPKNLTLAGNLQFKDIVKVVITVLFIISGFLSEAESFTIEGARKAFHKAVLDESESRSFYEYMQSFENSAPTVTAYKAVSEAMLARVLWNPFSKINQVVKYQKEMEKAVAADPNDIEIRFLRLAIEYNLPSFLGMSDHVEEDVDIILANLSSATSLKIDPSYGRYIFYFLEQADLCSSDQIVAMRASLEKEAF